MTRHELIKRGFDQRCRVIEFQRQSPVIASARLLIGPALANAKVGPMFKFSLTTTYHALLKVGRHRCITGAADAPGSIEPRCPTH